MAFTKKNEQKYTYVLNDVQNVRKWDDGGITFTAIVNGVYIYGLRVVVIFFLLTDWEIHMKRLWLI